MLAMEVNDDAGSLTPRGALRFFASKLAPTWAHYAEPPLGLTMWQENQKPIQKQKRGGLRADLIPSERIPPVGAGLSGRRIAAMVVNDDARCLNECVVQTFFASKLAPTVDRVRPWEMGQL
ncbi:hypothetical protein EMIT0P218_280027 [Pseudomonas sp. IT-P218]